MPDGLNKLIMEVYSMPIEQQNYLWGALGAKYLPSVLYRLRLVVMNDERVHENQPAVSAVKTTLEDKLTD